MVERFHIAACSSRSADLHCCCAEPSGRRRLAHKLVWITLVIAAVTALAGITAGKDLYLMIETGIALSVAAIPEGLTIVATMALARGMWRMARRNVLVNRLSAVETLGATGIVCTDKTGTLTENRLTVTRFTLASGDIEVAPPSAPPAVAKTPRSQSPQENLFMRDGEPVDPARDPLLREALEIGVLCNNASLPPDESEDQSQVGDPLEVALLRVAALARLHRP